MAAATQNQAFNSLLLLNREVLKVDIGDLIGVTRARSIRRLPTVLSQDELARLFSTLADPYKLMAQLLYGSGMRLYTHVLNRAGVACRSPLDPM